MDIMGLGRGWLGIKGILKVNSDGFVVLGKRFWLRGLGVLSSTVRVCPSSVDAVLLGL